MLGKVDGPTRRGWSKHFYLITPRGYPEVALSSWLQMAQSCPLWPCGEWISEWKMCVCVSLFFPLSLCLSNKYILGGKTKCYHGTSLSKSLEWKAHINQIFQMHNSFISPSLTSSSDFKVSRKTHFKRNSAPDILPSYALLSIIIKTAALTTQPACSLKWDHFYFNPH